MRLFLAIELPADARQALGRVQARLRAALGSSADDVRWVAPDRMHLTLHFIGEVSVADLGRLRVALGSSLPVTPADIHCTGLGVFVRRKVASVIWMGIGGDLVGLESVHSELARRLERGGWVRRESRAYAPHLTLGRVREGRRGVTGEVAGLLAPSDVEAVAWRATEVVLLASELGRDGPTYDVQHTLPLVGG